MAGEESAIRAVWALQSALEFCLLDQCFSILLDAIVFCGYLLFKTKISENWAVMKLCSLSVF